MVLYMPMVSDKWEESDHLRMTAQQLYDSPHGESLPPPFSHHSSIFPDGDGIYNMMILITFDDSMFFSVSKNFN